jgi:integrase
LSASPAEGASLELLHSAATNSMMSGQPNHMTIRRARRACGKFDVEGALARKRTLASGETFQAVAEAWLKAEVDADPKRTSRPQARRSAKEKKRLLATHVLPKWAERSVHDIKRSDIANLLAKIQRNSTEATADSVLREVISPPLNWYEGRHDNFHSPVVAALKSDKRTAAEKARDRILDEPEIRALWQATEGEGRFNGIVRLLLLTAQRLAKVQEIKHCDLRDGVWTIATEPGEKGNAGSLRLPPLAGEVIAGQKVVDDNPYVFAGKARGRPYRNLVETKARLDHKMKKTCPGMDGWRLHDLRRTARSLLARAGVADRVAEQVLGHKLKGVELIYNRHRYEAEKAAALLKLEELVREIVGGEEVRSGSSPG